jgi:hypothetical protein
MEVEAIPVASAQPTPRKHSKTNSVRAQVRASVENTSHPGPAKIYESKSLDLDLSLAR